MESKALNEGFRIRLYYYTHFTLRGILIGINDGYYFSREILNMPKIRIIEDIS